MDNGKSIKVTEKVYKDLLRAKADYIKKYGKNITISELIEVKKV